MKDDLLEFYVEDQGIGIPENRLEAIFDRFVQADIEDVKVFEGSGLGLSISKEYVGMLGGEIWVESTVGIGSKFYFSIPYIRNGASKVKPKTVNHENELSDLKILIAEDEEVSYKYLSILLSDVSREIIHAKNGIEVVDLLTIGFPRAESLTTDLLNSFKLTKKY